MHACTHACMHALKSYTIRMHTCMLARAHRSAVNSISAEVAVGGRGGGIRSALRLGLRPAVRAPGCSPVSAEMCRGEAEAREGAVADAMILALLPLLLPPPPLLTPPCVATCASCRPSAPPLAPGPFSFAAEGPSEGDEAPAGADPTTDAAPTDAQKSSNAEPTAAAPSAPRAAGGAGVPLPSPEQGEVELVDALPVEAVVAAGEGAEGIVMVDTRGSPLEAGSSWSSFRSALMTSKVG